MNSCRRGLRNGVLVNPKLFILEKVNFGQLTECWSNLVKLVKLNQTWSNALQLCIIWYGSLQSTPLKENFRPRNSYMYPGRYEGTGFAFGPPAPKSPLRLGGSSKGLSLRIWSCCEAPSLPYPKSALAVLHRISRPSAQSLVSPVHVRDLEYTCVAWRCGTHYGLEKAPSVSLIYKPLDLPSQQSQKVECSEDLASLAFQNVPRPSKERSSRILDLQPQIQDPFFACPHSSFAYPELLSTWHA